MALRRNIDQIERIIESIESKIKKIFKRPKNREDSSELDNSWTELIATTKIFFQKLRLKAIKLTRRCAPSSIREI